jgi:phosphotransferase system HPr (HPr) family protein
MQQAEVRVVNPAGLHARPAALFVEEAKRFACAVRVENLDRPGRTADAKSLLSLLTLGVAKGHTVRLRCEGPDEAEALVALAALVASGLGEGTGEPAGA